MVMPSMEHMDDYVQQLEKQNEELLKKLSHRIEFRWIQRLDNHARWDFIIGNNNTVCIASITYNASCDMHWELKTRCTECTRSLQFSSYEEATEYYIKELDGH